MNYKQKLEIMIFSCLAHGTTESDLEEIKTIRKNQQKFEKDYFGSPNGELKQKIAAMELIAYYHLMCIIEIDAGVRDGTETTKQLHKDHIEAVTTTLFKWNVERSEVYKLSEMIR